MIPGWCSQSLPSPYSIDSSRSSSTPHARQVGPRADPWTRGERHVAGDPFPFEIEIEGAGELVLVDVGRREPQVQQ